jgi:glycosyltransferase involved in cell wall biosynthesis
MKLLWFTWKDLSHPEAGGAERVNEEIAKRLARDGHEVIFLVGGFQGGEADVQGECYRIIRLGNRYTVYWHGYRYYKTHLQGWADLVIDEMNAIPFFCKYYVDEPSIVLTHQLNLEMWFYIFRFPLSLIGFMLEPVCLWLQADQCVITVSESTKRDLIKYGFRPEKISIIREGITAEPVEDLSKVDKFKYPTILSLGRITPAKRTLDQLDAFEIAKKQVPDLRLKIVGSAVDGYEEKMLYRIGVSDYVQDIEYLGHVSESKKNELMQKSHLILVTSVKEGWGLIVTEANSQGTPAIAYNVDGLRDSVRNGDTGVLTKENNPNALAGEVVALLRDKNRYNTMRRAAWQDSLRFDYENSYSDFLGVIDHIQ